MAIKVKRYIGSNGEILLPISESTYNSSSLISSSGVYFLAVTEEVVIIEAGNPIGMLLTLTYADTP